MIRSHIDRVLARELRAELKSRAIVAITVGAALALVSFYRYLFVVDVNDTLWRICGIVGILIFAFGVIVPDVLFWLDSLVRSAGNLVGKLLFGSVLLLCYGILCTLKGTMRRKYAATFLWWTDATPPIPASSWRAKQMTVSIADPRSRRRPLFLMPLVVMNYFARQKQYILMPVLLIMIVLGLLLFFLQTSAFAPFIYTLF